MAPRIVPVTATRATSDKITASGWNAGPVASNTFLTLKPNFSDSAATGSLASGTLTSMPLTNPPIVDTDSGYSATTKYICQVAGWYLVAGSDGWGLNATGQRQVIIRKNGADIRAASSLVNGCSENQGGTTPVLLVQLAVNDYVEVWSLQNSGSGMGRNPSSTAAGGLSAIWVSS